MQLLFFILILALCLTIHELGHFTAGLLFGIKMKSICIFLNPWFHLFSTHDKWFLRLFPGMARRPAFIIGWLPLGAYVRFETRPETEEEANDPRLLSSKPAWQRLIVNMAGVGFNYLSAIMFFALSAFASYPKMPADVAAWDGVVFTNNDLVTLTGALTHLYHHSWHEYSPNEKWDYDMFNHFSEQYGEYIEEDPNKGVYYRLVQEYPKRLDISRLAMLAYELSLGLLLFNMIPIPPLDGGQALCTLYELVTRRMPHWAIILVLNLLGLIFILGYSSYSVISELLSDLGQ